MKKVLLTGFEPFGAKKYNPSYEAVLGVGALDGIEIKKLCLPVTWDGAPEKLMRAIEEFDPDAVIMCGLASGRREISVERVGVNICGAIKDNVGNYPSNDGAPCEKAISNDGADAYFSTFDHRKILDAMKEENIPSGYSFSAGTYICNLVLYTALEKDRRERRNRKIGFIHVPDAKEFEPDAAIAIPLKTAIRALEIAVINC